MSRFIETERYSRSIREVVLCRAERRNALSIDLLEQLHSTLESLADEADLRVVILRGDGPVFSSGLDLKEAAEETLIERSAAALERTLRLVHDTPLILIAAVQGGTYAGGAGLMAACDIVVAAEDVHIGFPEARRGLVPALISHVLRRKVREGDLRDLFLVGAPIDGRRAMQVGLVQYLVPPGNLLSEARRIAESVVSGGPNTIRMTKQLLNDLFEASHSPQERPLADLHLAARRSAEAREGLAAYMEKRPPAWIQKESP